MNVRRIPMTTANGGSLHEPAGIVAVSIAPSSMIGAVEVGGKEVRAGDVVWFEGQAMEPVRPLGHFYRADLVGDTWSVDLTVWTKHDIRAGQEPRPSFRGAWRAERLTEAVPEDPVYTEVLRVPFVGRDLCAVWMTPLDDAPAVLHLRAYGVKWMAPGTVTQSMHVRELGTIDLTTEAAPTFALGALTGAARLANAIIIEDEDYDVLHLFASGDQITTVHITAEACNAFGGGG
jgi:hypothetical protein